MKKKKRKNKFGVFILIIFLIILFTVTYKVLISSNETVKVNGKAPVSNNDENEENKDKLEDTKVNENNNTNDNAVNKNESNNTSSSSNNNNDVNMVDDNKTNNDFTKDVAAKYFMDSEKEYKDYILEKDNDEFFLCENGKKVIGLLFYDKEKSPETGLDYFGYRLVNLDYIKQGGSGTIEYGYIYEDGSISHE